MLGALAIADGSSLNLNGLTGSDGTSRRSQTHIDEVR